LELLEDMNLKRISQNQLKDMLKWHHEWRISVIEKKNEVKNNCVKLSLSYALLKNLNFVNESFNDVEFGYCRFVNCLFKDCDFSTIQFNHNIVENCSFESCNFYKSIMTRNNCERVNFTKSNFTRTELHYTDFRFANLTNCMFDWSWLIETDFREAILEGVNFAGTRFMKTKLYNSKRYHLGSFKNAVIDNDLDFSLDGNDPHFGIDAIDKYLQI
jgi:uncharacterized protein YjbI with pentapeptide repeats